MFEAVVPTAPEAMPNALGVTTTLDTNTTNLSISSSDVVEISSTDRISDNEQPMSPAPVGKRKNRNPKSTGSPKVVILGPHGVINRSVAEAGSSQNLSDFVSATDLDDELNLVETDLSDEEAVKLAEQIVNHWSEHQKKKVSVAKSRSQLKMLRTWLASELYEYKRHLVRVGRDGGWAPFLREHDIPLSTADRYVKQHEESLVRSGGNLLTEEIPVPTKDDVTKLVKKLEPKLTKVLTTSDAVTQFLDELGTVLNRWEPSE